MALDPQSIEKKDFPIGRRGYEPEAVDAHLEALSAEVQQLKRAKGAPASAGAASLALAASEQVRTIVEAAELSASAIEAAAQDEAARIRREAESAARDTRDDAVAKSAEHVGKVAESTQLMLQRIDAMESELGALIESLRTGANRLNADLTLLQGNMGELYGAAGSTAAAAAPPAPPAPAPEPVEPEPVPAAVVDVEPEPEPVVEIAPEPAAAEPGLFASTEAAPAPAAAPAADGDVEGARLIALNMALNGSSREETDKYLSENFDLGDRAGLLDEVYATIG